MEEFAKKYYKLLTVDYAGINLTRINDFDEFYNKQIIDSIVPLEQSPIFKDSLERTKFLIDVGFGGGFPLLPLAYLNPDKAFVGVETRAKKCKVVGEIARLLGLNNIQFVHSRVEELDLDRDALVTFKAVGQVEKFLGCLNSDNDIDVFFYKGPSFDADEGSQVDAVKNRFKLIEKRELTVPNTEKRLLVGFKKTNVPRGTIQKNLSKLSDLITIE